MATQRPRAGQQEQVGGTTDDGAGTHVVAPTGPTEVTEAPQPGDKDAPPVAGFTPEGDRPQVEQVTPDGEGGEPGFKDRADADAENAKAYDSQAAEFAAFQQWRAEQVAGAEADRTNAAARAFAVDEHQQGPSRDQTVLLAANPGQFAVTREQGVMVHIPADPPPLTPDQVKAGDQPAQGYALHRVVPVGSPLPEGVTHEQLQYLIMLGWVRPTGSL